MCFYVDLIISFMSIDPARHVKTIREGRLLFLWKEQTKKHMARNVTMDIYTHLDQKHKALNADKLNQFLSPTNIKLQA